MKKEVADFKISIRRSTKERLLRHGVMTDTWDSVINRLLDEFEKCQE